MSLWPPSFARREPFVVAVDTAGFVCQAEGSLHTAANEDLTDLLRHVPAGVPLEMHVASDLAVHWLQQVPDALQSFAELRQAAGVRCAQIFGGKSAEWHVAADWRADGDFICAGLPRASMTSIEAALEPRVSRVAWSTTLSALLRAHARQFPANGWSCLRIRSTFALWHSSRGVVDSLSTHRVDPAETRDEVRERAHRHILVEAARGLSSADADLHYVAAPGGASEAEAALRLRIALEQAA